MFGTAPEKSTTDAAGTKAPVNSILVVDDEFDSRRALEILLELHGFDVTPAANGAEALHILRDRKFDIILTDWMMPVMSGQELLARLSAEKIAEGQVRFHRVGETNVDVRIVPDGDLCSLREPFAKPPKAGIKSEVIKDHRPQDL